MIGKTQQISSFLRRHGNYFFLFAFFLLTLFAHRKLLGLFPLAYGDLAPFPISAKQAFDEFFFVWKDRGLGLFRSPGYIFPLIEGLYLLPFRDSGMAQLAFLVSSATLGYITISYVFRKYIKINNELLIFVFSTFYVYSPIMMGEFIGGTLYSTIISFYFYPLLYFWTSDVIEKPNIYRFSRLLLCLGFTLSINAHFVVIYPLALLIPFVISLIHKWQNIYKWLLVLVICLGSFLFSSNFFSNTSGFISNTKNDGGKSNFANTIPKFLNEVHYSYASSQFINSFRGGAFINPMGYAKNNPAFIAFLSILVGAVFYALLRKSQFENYFYFSVLPNFIFFAAIIALTGYEKTDWIFEKFPFLFMFRNPAKLTASGNLYAAILMITFVNMIISQKKVWIKSFVLILTAAVVFAYIKPVFIGDRGLVSIAGNNNISIPPILNEASKDLHNIRGEMSYPRSIWMPSSHEKTAIKLYWLDPYKLEPEIGIGEFSDSYLDEAVSRQIVDSVLNKNAALFKESLSSAGVGYLVLINDHGDSAGVTHIYGATTISSGSKQIENIAKEAGLSEIVKKEGYSIFINRSVHPFIAWENISSEEGKKLIPLNFQKINPSRYTVEIPEGPERKLIMNQIVNSGWHIKTQDNRLADKINSSHGKYKTFANQWLLPSLASPQAITIDFVPQKELNISLLVSLTMYLGCFSVCIIFRHQG